MSALDMQKQIIYIRCNMIVHICWSGLNNDHCHSTTNQLQYFHPLEAAKYRKISRAIRAIGRDCIKKRIQLVENGQQVPNDILTHILQGACMYINNIIWSLHNICTTCMYISTCMSVYIYAYLALATRESVDIEELVDDFVTFYVAGQETTSNMLTFALVLTLQHPNVLERLIY